MRDIFFDIESGGLQATRNQLLSLSWGTDQKPIKTRYADLAPGSFLSKWSENKVWKKIKGFDRTSEKNILMEFLDVLETAPQDTRLIGWNIGYSPFQQNITKASGFDVSFLISRAKKYGLDHRYQKVLKRVKIHDEGALWAYRISKTVTSAKGQRMFKEGRLAESVYMEAVGYMKQAGKLAAEQGLSNEADIAEALSREGIQFAGWKQESTFKLLFHKDKEALKLLSKAHESETDVKMVRMLMGKGAEELNEDFIERWGKETLENKIVSSLKTVKAGGRERYLTAMAEAEKWGVSAGVTRKLTQFAEESGTPMLRLMAGEGALKSERMIRGRVLAETAEKAGIRGLASALDMGATVARAHWGKIAIGASALALLTLKPGAMFSGRDDEYNVIEGLPHGGQAERMRHMLTDFGSGSNIAKAVYRAEDLLRLYRGTEARHAVHEVVEEMLEQNAYRAHGLASEIFEQVRKAEFPHRPSRLTSTFWSPDAVTAELFATGPSATLAVVDVPAEKAFYTSGTFWTEAKKAESNFDRETIRKYARKYWTGIKTSQEPIDMYPEVLIPGKVQEHISVKTGGFDPYDLVELEKKKEAVFGQQPGVHTFSGKDDTYNTIEGLPHGGEAQRMRHLLTDFGSGWLGVTKTAVGVLGKQLSGSGGKFALANLALGIGAGIATDSASTGFQATMLGFGAGSLGFFRGGWKGAYLGSLVGQTTGVGVGELSGKFDSTALSMGTGAITASVASSLITAGTLRGGMLWSGTKKLMSTINTKEEMEAIGELLSFSFGRPNGNIWLDPEGMSTLISGQIKGFSSTFQNNRILSHVTSQIEKHPSVMRYIDAAVGSPSLIDLAKASGGLEYAKFGGLSKAVAQDILEGLPLGIGTGLATAGIGYAFSGKDDEYNVIEGLRHGGEAERMRKTLTDFGSGARTMFGGSIAALLHKSPDVIRKGAGKWLRKQKVTNIPWKLKKQANDLSVQAVVAPATPENVAQIKSQLPNFKYDEGDDLLRFLYYDKPSLSAEMTSTFKRAPSKEEMRTLAPSVLAHEAFEIHHTSRLMRKGSDPTRTAFGSHRSSAVVADEMLFSAAIGKKEYEAMKGFRQAELSSMKEYRDVLTKDELEYIRRTEKMMTSFEKKLLPKFQEKWNKFSGFDDEYNTIEGLRHGGFAEWMRKKLTAFGSGARRFFGLLAEATGTGTKREGLKVLHAGISKEHVAKATKLFSRKEVVALAHAAEYPQAVGRLQADIFGSPVGGFKKEIMYDPDEVVRGVVEKGLSPAQGELLKPVALGHEFSEIHHGMRQIERNVSKRIARGEIVTEASFIPTIGTHVSLAPVADELLIAAGLGKETFEAAKAHRLAEAVDFEKTAGEQLSKSDFSKLFKKNKKFQASEKFKKRMDPDYVIKSGKDVQKSNLEYARRLRKMIATFEKKQLPKFKWHQVENIPTIDMADVQLIEDIPTIDPTDVISISEKTNNRIPDLAGLAAREGRKATDFGSPVDLDKAAARAQSMYDRPPVVSKLKSDILEPSRSMLKRKKAMQIKHREAQVSQARNSLRPGRRHRQQAGRLVI